MDIQRLEAWENWWTMKRKEPSTLRVYRCAVKRLYRFLLVEKLSVDKKKDAVPALTAWAASLVRERLQSGTIRDYFAAVAAYFEWEIRVGYRKSNPVRKVVPSLPDREPDHRDKLQPAQVRKLFDAAEHVERPWCPENARVILSLLAGCGLRTNEIRELRTHDVDLFVTQQLKLPGVLRKNHEDLVLPLVSRFHAMHEEWWWKRKELMGGATRPDNGRYLFITPRMPLGKEGIYTLFRRLLVIAELRVLEVPLDRQPRYFPHALRHFAGATFNQYGGLEAVAYFLGQKDLDTSRRYVELEDAHVRKIAVGPAARIWPELEKAPPPPLLGPRQLSIFEL